MHLPFPIDKPSRAIDASLSRTTADLLCYADESQRGAGRGITDIRVVLLVLPSARG